MLSSDLVPSKVNWNESQMSKYIKNRLDDKNKNIIPNSNSIKKLKPDE